jgi:hypothetical protein
MATVAKALNLFKDFPYKAKLDFTLLVQEI